MNNRKQGIKTITISTVIIQVITVLIAIYIYMEQQNVKKFFSAAEEVVALKSVPAVFFGLFCLAVGGCLWGGKGEKAVL